MTKHLHGIGTVGTVMLSDGRPALRLLFALNETMKDTRDAVAEYAALEPQGAIDIGEALAALGRHALKEKKKSI